MCGPSTWRERRRCLQTTASKTMPRCSGGLPRHLRWQGCVCNLRVQIAPVGSRADRLRRRPVDEGRAARGALLTATQRGSSGCRRAGLHVAARASHRAGWGVLQGKAQLPGAPPHPTPIHPTPPHPTPPHPTPPHPTPPHPTPPHPTPPHHPSRAPPRGLTLNILRALRSDRW